MIGAREGLLTLVLLGPPPPTLAPAELSTPEPAPLEGPTPVADEPPPAEPPGIEFAEPPTDAPDPLAPDDGDGSEVSGASEPSEAARESPEPAASWPTPGMAPGDGMAGITTGAILIGSATLMTLALYNATAGRQDRAAILGVGVGMGVLGTGMIGMGLYRHAKLRRWTLAYRVRAYPQGGGLLAAGSIALTFGVGLTASGVLALARDQPEAAAILLPIGAVSLAAIAPTTLVFGKRRRDRYLRTGGWYRPELPPIPTVRLAPMLSPTSAGVGLQGRF